MAERSNEDRSKRRDDRSSRSASANSTRSSSSKFQLHTSRNTLYQGSSVETDAEDDGSNSTIRKLQALNTQPIPTATNLGTRLDHHQKLKRETAEMGFPADIVVHDSTTLFKALKMVWNESKQNATSAWLTEVFGKQDWMPGELTPGNLLGLDPVQLARLSSGLQYALIRATRHLSEIRHELAKTQGDLDQAYQQARDHSTVVEKYQQLIEDFNDQQEKGALWKKSSLEQRAQAEFWQQKYEDLAANLIRQGSDLPKARGPITDLGSPDDLLPCTTQAPQYTGILKPGDLRARATLREQYGRPKPPANLPEQPVPDGLRYMQTMIDNLFNWSAQNDHTIRQPKPFTGRLGDLDRFFQELATLWQFKGQLYQDAGTRAYSIYCNTGGEAKALLSAPETGVTPRFNNDIDALIALWHAYGDTNPVATAMRDMEQLSYPQNTEHSERAAWNKFRVKFIRLSTILCIPWPSRGVTLMQKLPDYLRNGLAAINHTTATEQEFFSLCDLVSQVANNADLIPRPLPARNQLGRVNRFNQQNTRRVNERYSPPYENPTTAGASQNTATRGRPRGPAADKAAPKEKTDQLCFNCKERGHLVHNCPARKHEVQHRQAHVTTSEDEDLASCYSEDSAESDQKEEDSESENA